ncbi:unnamed protein product, partial [Medioppia subpectinata]
MPEFNHGPVPTGWKVEAVPKNPTDSDNTDMIIGVSIDERAQIMVLNANTSTRCKNVNEYINYTTPVIISYMINAFKIVYNILLLENT